MRFVVAPALAVMVLFAVLIGGLHLQTPHDLVSAACAPTIPCWQRFQPGVTTYNQTAVLFAEMGWILEVSYCQIQVSTCDSFQWRNPNEDGQKAVVFFEQGRVAAIWFINPNVTLGEILLAFGASQHTDEYAGFDLQGKPYTVYRSLWQMMASQVNVECPTTFALLVRLPVQVLTVADPIQPLDPSLVLSHNFRHACLT